MIPDFARDIVTARSEKGLQELLDYARWYRAFATNNSVRPALVEQQERELEDRFAVYRWMTSDVGMSLLGSFYVS